MKSFKLTTLVAVIGLSVGCQANRAFKPLAVTGTEEPPYSEAELAAVERVVNTDAKPVSLTSRLTGSSGTRSASRSSYSSRRS